MGPSVCLRVRPRQPLIRFESNLERFFPIQLQFSFSLILKHHLHAWFQVSHCFYRPRLMGSVPVFAFLFFAYLP